MNKIQEFFSNLGKKKQTEQPTKIQFDGWGVEQKLQRRFNVKFNNDKVKFHPILVEQISLPTWFGHSNTWNDLFLRLVDTTVFSSSKAAYDLIELFKEKDFSFQIEIAIEDQFGNDLEIWVVDICGINEIHFGMCRTEDNDKQVLNLNLKVSNCELKVVEQNKSGEIKESFNIEVGEVPIGGYIATFIATMPNGNKITKTRFIKKENKEAVEKFMNKKGLYISEIEFDNFYKSLD